MTNMLKPFTCEEIDEMVGPKCSTFEPGCANCDFWEMWDTHAYGAIQNEMERLRVWCAEWEEVMKDYDMTSDELLEAAIEAAASGKSVLWPAGSNTDGD